MPVMKTPGVYNVEKNAFPNSVVGIATALPAFVGYTEKADDRGRPLAMQPRRISSLAEFELYFGGAPRPRFKINPVDEGSAFVQGPQGYTLEQTGRRYRLYYGMRHFFQNGGGPCYIVSVGGYDDAIGGDALRRGIDTLIKEQEPTLVVVPDVVSLDEATCIEVQKAMLEHCGNPRQRNRFAILDVWAGTNRWAAAATAWPGSAARSASTIWTSAPPTIPGSTPPSCRIPTSTTGASRRLASTRWSPC